MSNSNAGAIAIVSDLASDIVYPIYQTATPVRCSTTTTTA